VSNRWDEWHRDGKHVISERKRCGKLKDCGCGDPTHVDCGEASCGACYGPNVICECGAEVNNMNLLGHAGCTERDVGVGANPPDVHPPEGSDPEPWTYRAAFAIIRHLGVEAEGDALARIITGFTEPSTPPPGPGPEGAVARRVVLANGNYCDRHEPELQLVCERCGSREATPPPGPGQDRQVVITQGERSMEQEHILQFFSYEHLPPKLQAVSKPFCDLAHAVVKGDNVPETGTVTIGGPLPRNPERTVALRKLLEAKDAAVRALLAR
jgi:hypothetical protein